MKPTVRSDRSGVFAPTAWSILLVFLLVGLTACGDGGTPTSESQVNSESSALSTANGNQLAIGAADLFAAGGHLVIEGRDFTGGYPPVVRLDGVDQPVTSYTSTEIRADYVGPDNPTGVLLLKVDKGPDLSDYDSHSVVIGDADPSDPVNYNQLVIWDITVEVRNSVPVLVIRGNNFDNGSQPVVTLGSEDLTVLSFEPSRIYAILPDVAGLAEGDLLRVQTGSDFEQNDIYDLNISDDSSQVPPGECYPCWTEGPEDKDPWHGGSVWYEPLYYQLEHDYIVDIPSYFTDPDRLPYGQRWRTDDLHDYALYDFPTVDVQYFGWDYLAVEPGGKLIIRKGYRWDGPTTSPLPYSKKIIHASMVHDAIYDLQRRQDIDRSYTHRLIADLLLYMISVDSDYSRARAWADFNIVRGGGWSKTDDALPEWKEHAVAEAGPDQEQSCGTPAGMGVWLDGSDSRHTRTWTWEKNSAQVAMGTHEYVFLTPGVHNITLTADDPYAENRNLYHYADTDDVMIDIGIDQVPPAILTPEQGLVVPNDPGECFAVVHFEVTASDDCSEPQVICDPSSGDLFPVGTQETVCTAVDEAGNTAEGFFEVTVEDVEPPVINVSPVAVTLWPPNHQYVTLAAADLVLSVDDNCAEFASVDLVITGAQSSEPDNDIGVGDGNTTDDIVVAPEGGWVKLRAERHGTGNGRVYTVHLAATDAWGNTGEATVQVVVPHSK